MTAGQIKLLEICKKHIEQSEAVEAIEILDALLHSKHLTGMLCDAQATLGLCSKHADEIVKGDASVDSSIKIKVFQQNRTITISGERAIPYYKTIIDMLHKEMNPDQG